MCSKKPTFDGGMPVKHCRACTISKTPAPTREMPYLAALNDTLGFGLDDVLDNLCDRHKEMVAHGQEVLADLMTKYKARKAS